ncbi:alpha-amylase family glycosyl hydrolase [Listeria ilorinensis]|uniref:alpha-amylase family glycosyl hydrolase n=1 Tax=Listeria ilorinensis TaxID=2867439 RepID=UPI001EF5F87C|nr:alpha-amylase family glycosyl hydrolase [Listeria ilorinensis]
MNRNLFEEQLKRQLRTLFTSEACDWVYDQLLRSVASFSAEEKRAASLSEKNLYLITYGDSILQKNITPLAALSKLLKVHGKGVVTDVHLLPMFPYTSDDGFSVTDYEAINPELGNWEDIERLHEDFQLMFDFVANHMSKSSEWFQAFLAEKPGFEQAFVEREADFDTTNVVRPRTSPLFHTFDSKKVWTTFSEDQVDVNVKDPQMFVRLTNVLLSYLQKGAQSIRLDAIGFLWKESGTTCMHLPQTHAVIQIWRLLADFVAPGTQIITETNVPHQENIQYFGDGHNEANMVYQFSLPPLVLYSFTTHDVKPLQQWAKTIGAVSDEATYFNFLASHDGIGLRPTEGLLSDEDRQLLAQKVEENGGFISYKTDADGKKSIYELNINYSDALRNKGESDELAVQKMLAAHHILLSFIGVPAIYYHSLYGSTGDRAGAEESGIARRINREKLPLDVLLKELSDPGSRRNQIYSGIEKMMTIRGQEKAFSPYGKQEIEPLDLPVLAIQRTHREETIYCYTNVSDQTVILDVPAGKELLSGESVSGRYQLPPYGFAWVKMI